MKMKLMQIAAAVSIAMLSSMAMAGGAGCDSKKGHSGSKDMSADAIQEFKDSHAWMFSDDAHSKGKSISKDDKVHQKSNDDSSDLVEI